MLLGVALSVSGILVSSSYFTVWTFIVIGTLALSSWLKVRCRFVVVVLYFIVSAVSGLLFLAGSLLSSHSFLLIQLSLSIKLGLFPFQFWVLPVLSELSLSSLCFFLGPTKISLLYLLVSTKFCSLLLPCLALVFGLFVLFTSCSLSLVLYASGSCQLIFLILLGPSPFPVFYFSYLLSLLAISLIDFKLLRPLVAFLCLGGMPPFTFFWGKFLAIIYLPLFWGIFLVMCSGIILFPYIKLSLGLGYQHSTSFLALFLVSSASGLCFLIVF